MSETHCPKRTRRLSIPQDIREAVGMLRAFRDDLPDGMYEDVSDALGAISDYVKGIAPVPEWDCVRDEINAVCADWGFPAICSTP